MPEEELGVAAKAIAVHEGLERAGLPHAIGGALALAYCVIEPRGTVDVDVGVFVDPAQVDDVLAALPAEVAFSDEDRALLLRDGQARLRWGRTPIDVFLATRAFHGRVA